MKKTLLFSSLFACAFAFGQTTQDDGKVEVIYPTEFRVSKPLIDIAEIFPVEEGLSDNDREESKDREHRIAQAFKYTVEKDGPAYGNDESTIQREMGTRTAKAPLTNWAGQNGGGYPPDPSGAVGMSHYVQAVNATPLKVFNKTTGANMLTTSVGALFGTPTVNDGDPIILYDKYADRWFVSQFGVSGNKIYIAISQTNSPTGSWYLYTFTSAQFPDYLKFSVWHDGYYMTSNQGTDKIFCFERDQMLLGNPSARSIVKNFTTGSVSGFFVPMPADADGGLPPAGTPLPFFSYYENSWGGGTDCIKIWTMTTTWAATPTATVSATPTSIPTAAFDGTYDSGWDDISQPTPSTQKLDGIGGIVQFRAQWRKWTTYNTVVLNWPVKLSATQRSIKWAELRQNIATGVWSLYQEGIYAPDTRSRWVGSIAMDDNGSIALCYARCSAAAGDYASLAYTGRLATDPLGTMSFAETVAIAGTASQGSGINRFGDYSQTSLDPANGITFWHTGEYLGSGPRTRIYSFQLPLASGVAELSSQIQMNVSVSGNNMIVQGSNLGADEEMVVDLFDISGRSIAAKTVVSSGSALETSFDVSALAQGTYLVRIGKKDTYFQKVTKVAITK